MRKRKKRKKPNPNFGPDKFCPMCGVKLSPNENETPGNYRKRVTCSRLCAAQLTVAKRTILIEERKHRPKPYQIGPGGRIRKPYVRRSHAES